MLISTDVDKIISALREKKRAQLGDLAEELGMQKSQVKKWADVLETQGMIKIEHKLTREYLIWADTKDATGSNYKGAEKKESIEAKPLDLSIVEQRAQSVQRPIQQAPHETPVETPVKTDQERLIEEMERARKNEERIRFALGKPVKSHSDETAEYAYAKEVEEPETPGEPLPEIGEEAAETIEAAQTESISKPARHAAGRIKPKAAQSGGGKGPAVKKQPGKAIRKIRKTSKAPVTKTKPSRGMAIEVKKPRVVLGKAAPRRGEPEQRAPMQKPERKVSSLAEMLSAQMEKIRMQEERISGLKEEKAKLLVEHLEPIERKLQAEIDTVSEKLTEKQKIILELEQKASEIPAVVEGIDQKNAKVAEVEQEARTALDNARIELEDILSELEGVREVARDRIDEIEKTAAAASAKLESVRKSHSNITRLIESANESLEATRASIEEQISRMEEIESEMESLEEYKSGLEADVEQAQKSVMRQKNLARVLAEHTNTISAVDEWAKRQFEEYEKQVEELSELSASNERDFASLRESVETSFVRRYVSELSGILKRHEYEIGTALEAEKSIDQRLEQEKEKLRGLIGQGRDMASILQEKNLPHTVKTREMEKIIHSKQEKIESISQRIKNRDQITRAAREAVAKLGKEEKD